MAIGKLVILFYAIEVLVSRSEGARFGCVLRWHQPWPGSPSGR